jgi:hypothetical protein
MDTLLKDTNIFISYLFKYQSGITLPGYYQSFREFVIVDSIVPNNYNTRRCKFRYHYTNSVTDTIVKDTVFDCYEFYFDHPYISDSVNTGEGYQDTIYIGKINNSRSPIICEHWMNLLSSAGYAAIGHPFPGNKLYFSADITVLNDWGPIFPIVHPRCVSPRAWLTSDGNGQILAWEVQEGAEDFEVSMGDYGSDPDSGDVTTLPSHYRYLPLRWLDNDRHYSAWVRKGCRYTIGGNDTVVWSPWSSPVDFYGPESPAPPDDPDNPDNPDDPDNPDNPGGDTVGIAESAYGHLFSVHPNPATNMVRVESGERKVESIEVVDMLGRVVLRKQLPAPASSLLIDTSPLPSGSYLLRLYTREGIVNKRLSLTP